MIAFPPAKINIGLQVLGKRADGFHDLNTIFYPLPFYDALEFVRNENGPEFSFGQTGLRLNITPEENLVAKAYHLLKANHPKIGNISAHLHKAIPSGAGLGGGSSDASSMLKLLNDAFQLGLSTAQLLGYALTLGSDCPFFINNKPALAGGKGEKLSALQLDLSGYDILLVNPGIEINTGWAFSQLKSFKNFVDLSEAIHLPMQEWKTCIQNDFEAVVFESHPEIAQITRSLYSAGALYASLTGTGSTVYGIFPKDQSHHVNFPSSYFIKWC